MQDFIRKRDALFACLDDARNQLNPTILQQNSSIGLPNVNTNELNETANNNYRGDSKYSQHSNNKTLKQFRGKESIFKKPELPIRKCLKPREIPAYKRNPDKWTKYNLSDVDISDHTNTTAAFDFLQQLDKRKAESEEQLQSISSNRRIEFKKSIKMILDLNTTNVAEVADVETDLPKFRSNKFIMPECVVGQMKKNKPKKKPNICEQSKERARAAGNLQLAHLTDDSVEE